MPEATESQLDELRRRARRRLVGAVVLALAAAVVVPMLLESDPKPLGEDVSVRIPPVDDGRFVSKLGDKARTADAAPAKPASAAGESAESSAAAKDAQRPPAGNAAAGASTAKSAEVSPSESIAAKPAGKESPPIIAKDAAKPAGRESGPNAAKEGAEPRVAAKTASEAPAGEVAKTGKPAAGSFSVQLAAFIDDKGANALANRLKKGGHPAYTEPYETSRGTLWRVRVGPYASREAAEAARTKLKADGQNGIIAAAN